MKRTIYILCLLLSVLTLQAQNAVGKDQYMRSSLYSILIRHLDQEYDDEIADVFYEMPLSDKFDDHSLNIQSVSMPKDKKDDLSYYYDESPLLESTGALSGITKNNVITFVERNDIGKQFVSHWFNRDDETGRFNVDLVLERGNYNANAVDVQYALQTIRGLSLLQDAGEDLISQTFLIVNDIKYIDKEKHAQRARMALSIIGAIFGAAGSVASAATGNSSYYAYGQLGQSTAMLGATISDAIAGFTVNVSTHLFQLDWNEENSHEFYKMLWIDNKTPADSVLLRKERYEYMRGLFPMKYLGSYTARSQKTVLRGVYTPEDVIKKVCTRAIDNNIVELQRRYEPFRVKVTISSVGPNNTIMAPIGMKEGVTVNSKFEVLERYQLENGRTTYRRIGVVKPVKNKICDNRFMAAEEQAAGSDLEYTTFSVVSSTKPIYAGALLREIRFESGGQ